MIASNLHLRVHRSRERGRQPQEVPRFMMVLVVVLALVNVSATVLMAGTWASITDGMLELEESIQDRLTETVN
jgi:multisubunit Na+/H+ antiporter MnhB subunit